MSRPDAPVRQSLAPTGRLRAAINFGNQLLAARGADGAPRGVSAELAQAIADRLALPVDWVPFSSAGAVFDALREDRWDLAFLAIDPQRSAGLDFSAPYVLIEGTYLVRAQAPWQRAAELDAAGVRIAATRGSAYELHLTRTLRHAELVREPQPDDALRAFLGQGLDALAAVRQPLDRFAAEHAGLRVLPDAFMRIAHAMAIPRGRAIGHAWLEGFVAQAKSTGWIAQSLSRNGQSGVQVAS